MALAMPIYLRIQVNPNSLPLLGYTDAVQRGRVPQGDRTPRITATAAVRHPKIT